MPALSTSGLDENHELRPPLARERADHPGPRQARAKMRRRPHGGRLWRVVHRCFQRRRRTAQRSRSPVRAVAKLPAQQRL